MLRQIKPNHSDMPRPSVPSPCDMPCQFGPSRTVPKRLPESDQTVPGPSDMPHRSCPNLPSATSRADPVLHRSDWPAHAISARAQSKRQASPRRFATYPTSATCLPSAYRTLPVPSDWPAHAPARAQPQRQPLPALFASPRQADPKRTRAKATSRFLPAHSAPQRLSQPGPNKPERRVIPSPNASQRLSAPGPSKPERRPDSRLIRPSQSDMPCLRRSHRSDDPRQPVPFHRDEPPAVHRALAA